MLAQSLPLINLVIAGLGFLIVMLILAAPSDRRLAAYMLAAYIAIQSTVMVINYLGWEILPRCYLISLSIAYFCMGPLLYTYTRLLISSSFTLNLSHLKHVVASVIAGICILIWVDEPTYMVIMLMWLASYAIAVMRRLAEYQRFIHDTCSTLDDVSLSWLNKIVLLCLVSSLLMIAIYLLAIFSVIGREHSHFLFRCWNFSQFLLIAVAGCRSHLLSFGGGGSTSSPQVQDKLHPASEQIQLSGQQDSDSNNRSSAVNEKDKYSKSPLSQDSAEALWQELNNYMDEHEPFLDCGLKMPQLASSIGISPHDLSQAVNKVSGQNFYDYVNKFRARKARELILAQAREKISMIDIALAAGFASKATFYKHFKAHYSMTPAIFKKSCMDDKN